jgi:hypothetical protein
VLGGGHDTAFVMSIPLNMDNGIDEMFKRTWPGKISVLGDVSDEDQCLSPVASQTGKLLGSGANLSYSSTWAAKLRI